MDEMGERLGELRLLAQGAGLRRLAVDEVGRAEVRDVVERRAVARLRALFGGGYGDALAGLARPPAP